MAISSALGFATSISNGFGFRNLLINGDMIIDQRALGTSISVNSYGYTVDRWKFNNYPNGYLTVGKNSNGITPPSGFTNYLGVKTVNAHTLASSSYFYISQAIEGFNSAFLSWGTASAKPVVLSFWVNASIAGTYSGALEASSSRSYVFTYTINTADTWEYKTVFIPGDVTGVWTTDNGAGVIVMFSVGMGSNFCGPVNSWSATDTMGAANTVSIAGIVGAKFSITGVQFEQNTQATPFERRPIGVELALCQRYYETSDGMCAVAGGSTGFGGNTYFGSVQFKVNKRAVPTLYIYDVYSPYAVNTMYTWQSASGASQPAQNEGITTTSFHPTSKGASRTDVGLGRFTWKVECEL